MLYFFRLALGHKQALPSNTGRTASHSDQNNSLREKCPYSKLFWSIFSHSDWIQRDAEYLFVFSPNTEKYAPKKLRIRTVFTQWWSLILNPFLVSVSFLYPLKTLENQNFSDVFRGYRNEILAWNGFKIRDHHCVKRLRIRSFSRQYFPAFGLNMEKIRTRVTPNRDTFYVVTTTLWNN